MLLQRSKVQKFKFSEAGFGAPVKAGRSLKWNVNERTTRSALGEVDIAVGDHHL